jgi:hypothetical protein
MPLEIRELIIRATVTDQTNRNTNNALDIDAKISKIKKEIMRELSEKLRNDIKTLIYNR